MAMNGNEGGSAYPPPNTDVKSGSCLIAGFQPLTVFHPSYWNAYKAESGATFSIDMVRLKLSFINGKGEWLSTHAQTFDCDSMSAWTSKIRPGATARQSGDLIRYTPLVYLLGKKGERQWSECMGTPSSTGLPARKLRMRGRTRLDAVSETARMTRRSGFRSARFPTVDLQS